MSTRIDSAPLVALVDPDPQSRRLSALLLANRGFTTVEYSSGADALARWHRNDDPAACVLDFAVADMAPLSLLGQLRELRHDLSVLAITPGRDARLASEALRAGAYDHLARPVEPDRFVQCVVRAVERHQLAMRLRMLEQRSVYASANNDQAVEAATITPLPELERREIERALRVTGGSVGKAAKLLGLSRATLYRRLAEQRPVG